MEDKSRLDETSTDEAAAAATPGEAAPGGEDVSWGGLVSRYWLSTLAGLAMVALAAYMVVRSPTGTTTPTDNTVMAGQLVNIGTGYHGKGQLDIARAFYAQAIILNPRQETALNNIGSIALQQGQPLLAEYWFVQSLAADPNFTLAQKNLELAKAKSALVADGGMSDVMNAALQARDKDSDPERALSLLQFLLSKKPDHFGGIFQCARTLDSLGRRSEARPMWAQVAEIAKQINDIDTLTFVQARLAEMD